MLNEILQGGRLGRYVPIIGWVRSYQREWLSDDLVSGVVVQYHIFPSVDAAVQHAA
jgi:MFS superfamily sulfate permease-like transporter